MAKVNWKIARRWQFYVSYACLMASAALALPIHGAALTARWVASQLDRLNYSPTLHRIIDRLAAWGRGGL